MNNSAGKHNPLIRKSRQDYSGEGGLANIQNYVIPIAVILIAVLTIPSVFSALTNSAIITNFGTVQGMSPLHTEARYIKDSSNRIIILRGVWLAEYADSCVGAWDGDYYNWDEANVRADMQNLRDVWHVNVINTFIWGNWWRQDLAVTLGGYETSDHYRFAIKEAARIAQQYGLYFQIRLWATDPSEGRIEQPYSPYSTVWTRQDFINFWASVATELKGYPNVIFQLYDEPDGNVTLWFETAKQAITAIRNAGAENLVVVHWQYCGDNMWIADWIDGGYPTHNIVFSNHIYRFHGTFDYNPDSPVDINYIRTQLGDNIGNHRAYKYITDTYNVPIWASAIGAYDGATDNNEYTYFKNTLQVLNEWNISYAAYQWFRSDMPWFIGDHQPNRVGQALIDANIAGIG